MNTRRYINFSVLTFIIVIACFTINIITTHAEKIIIVADGYSIMGDGPEENPAVAQERARKDAKRAASEKAGGITEVKNGLIRQLNVIINLENQSKLC